ncbi:kinase-like domain-containing protein [Mycena alexandri]|uniref:Kinase-like domain-containing protein n=1 Tax=Mycena alexandri TaxID=1745969 RepID=A0AAD6TLK9_9AGAR|nr:kinase-like domain-containing protein [Mycena alexandri]
MSQTSSSWPSASTVGTVAVSLGKSAIQISADFAPIPGLGPATDLLFGIIQLCQNVPQNRKAAVQLSDRCYRLGLVLRDKYTAKENVDAAIASFLACLQLIQTKMAVWANLGKIKSFIQQQDIAQDIKACHELLTDSLSTFHLISQVESHSWQAQFQMNAQADHLEFKAQLSNIENSQDIILAAVQAGNSDVKSLMSMVQQWLGDGSRTHSEMANLLYDLQINTHEPLPDFHLRRGEVVRTGDFPVSGSVSMDIYEGRYLGREKVAIKVIRAVNLNDDDLREKSLRRFMRECEIWRKVWEVDEGKHILQFYGFCQRDVPFPYMVSPWQSNGSALPYIKRIEKAGYTIDYLKLVKGIALGVEVLHGMNPPVVHGDIKASNIVIDSAGNPLLADFGLSHIMEDITGVPFSQSRGVSDSYRWFAPELCVGPGVLSLGSDIYAYAMTVLELFTHQQPFNDIKHTSEIVVLSVQEFNPLSRPSRPTSQQVLGRGLNDELWALLRACWAHQPLQRPTIQQVLTMLPQ